MADIFIPQAEWKAFEQKVKDATKDKMATAFIDPKMESMLFNISKTLTRKIADSPEWHSLKTDLVGEFGFTPEELPHIDEILKFIEDGNGITEVRVKIQSNKMIAVLEWVNFDALEKHPLAFHPLTKKSGVSGPFLQNGSASWIDWLENGKTVTGYEFNDVKNNPFSRSKEGLMRKEDGGQWVYEPSDLFHRTGLTFDKEILKSGFLTVFKKNRKR